MIALDNFVPYRQRDRQIDRVTPRAPVRAKMGGMIYVFCQTLTASHDLVLHEACHTASHCGQGDNLVITAVQLSLN